MSYSKYALLSAFLTVAAISTASAEVPVPAAQEKAAASAKAAIGDLAGRLKEALSTALKEKGPEGALDVCKSVAPQAAKAAGEQHKLTIKRTALKVRNSANGPDEFEARILADFMAKANAGTDVQTLAYSQVFESGGAKQLRFMKAIPMAEQPCAVCHGAQVKPELLEKIRALYPQDQATGFVPGQMRGAFSVTVPME
ncbi:MAG: DUF3365 domain-containing protein [Hyphomicrobiaceae bacterium]